MCDLVNSNFARHGKDCVKALKLKIMKKSAPDRQMLALIAMEMCMKNCGSNFHLMAIAKDVPHEMAKLATAAGVAEEVHDKTLVLIRDRERGVLREPAEGRRELAGGARV
jgi:hypothetical protein